MLIGVGLLCLLSVVAAFHAPSALTKKRYDGYKVFSVVPEDRASLQILHDMMVKNSHIDFWKEPSKVGKQVTFMVPPNYLIPVVTMMRKSGIQYTIDHEDFQEEVLTPMWNKIDLSHMGPTPHAFNINDFNTLYDVYYWMQNDLIAACRTGLICETYTIGTSIEGRPIDVFKISKSGTGRKAYWVDATIHAREWITTATIQNIMYHMAVGGDANAVRLADSYDWYFVPIINVDGYSYSWTNDRMWRKNRRVTSSSCYGVDLNRNFDFRWGHDGVSFNPCDETYCGATGGSEPETQAVSAELVRVGPTLGAMVTLHSYGNMWLFPWGNTVNYDGRNCDFAADNADLMTVTNAAVAAIQSTYNEVVGWKQL
jgi:carboxypeptidase A2